jgi:hypothetical protein
MPVRRKAAPAFAGLAVVIGPKRARKSTDEQVERRGRRALIMPRRRDRASHQKLGREPAVSTWRARCGACGCKGWSTGSEPPRQVPRFLTYQRVKEAVASGNRLWERYWREAPAGANFVIHFSARAKKTVQKLLKTDRMQAEQLWDSIQKLYFEQYWPPGNPHSSLNIRSCGPDKNGYTVYKFRGNHKHIRGYFRAIKDDDEAELPIVYIDDLTTAHDQDEGLRERVLSRVVSPEEIRDVVLPIVPDLIKRESPPGGSGEEYKQLLWVNFDGIENAMEWLESDANIIPNPRQMESIYEPSPVLINGQAGTGKTSMLAARAAWVVANCREQGYTAKILCTAYSQKVVDLLKNQINAAITYKHRQGARADVVGDCDFKTFPEVLRDLLDEPSRARFAATERRVGFARFNREFYQPLKKAGRARRISAEFSWYVIRSILKGMREDAPLSIEDFSFSSGGGSLPRKLTEDLTREDVAEAITLNEKYEKWLGANDLYDDVDLALAAWRTVKDRPLGRYDEIYLDEAQDLTRVEFRVLELLLKTDSPVPSKGLRIALAGDPQQTINPTGFNWSQIRALFWKGEPLKQTDLELNQRTPQPIVDLANAIQRQRKIYSKEPAVEQRAREIVTTQVCGRADGALNSGYPNPDSASLSTVTN